MSDNYSILIEKLDSFIRKYYKNQLIRGGIYCLTIILFFFLIINTLEYFGHFNSIIRTFIFYTFLIINAIVISRYLIISAFKLYKIGKIISNEYAAEIIGKHFPEVSDKLLNVLQLKQLIEGEKENILIQASIDQKIIQIKPVPFNFAIDLAVNKKYIKYPLIPIIILVIILFFSPAFISEPSTRLIKHNVYFEKKLPFQFVILNEQLNSIQQEDFKLSIKVIGTEIPDVVYINYDNTQYQLDKETTVLFNYKFKNLHNDVVFKLSADNYTTKEYLLKVLPKPTILKFNAEVFYPKYIGKKDEILENTGDIVVPEGSKIVWKFWTKDTKKIILNFTTANTKIITLNSSPSSDKNNTQFIYSDIIRTNQNYYITTYNEYMKNKDSVQYTINSIPDAFPIINVEEFKDSVYEKHIYYKGFIKDDYGLSKLNFHYKIKPSGKSLDTLAKTEIKDIAIDKILNQQAFYFYNDLSTIKLNAGDELEYYFEVWDNDGVNGAKSSRSQKMLYKEPDQKEVQDKLDNNAKQLQSLISQSINQAKSIQQQTEDLNRKFLEKKNLNWEEKKQIENLLDKQNELQKNVEDIKKFNLQNNIKENLYNKEENEELLKKKEELQKLFDEIMTDEMKNLMKQLEDLLKNLDKDRVNNMLDKIKLSSEDLEKQLDRNLEIMKQLEFEKKMKDVIQKLDDLAQKQDKIAEDTKNKTQDKDKLIQNQDQTNKDFENVRKDIKEAIEKNKKLENPNQLKSTEQQENNIQKDLQNSLNSLQNNNSKSATKSQKSAAEQMKSLTSDLQSEMDEMEQKNDAEDAERLRALLQNLVRVSFAQEDLMKELNLTSKTDPKYIKIINDQKKIKDDMMMIEDSLFALSKRQVQIKSFVNKKINEINQNIEKTITLLLNDYSVNYYGSGNKTQAASRQQFTMTAINDLALMLSESLDQMQKQMAAKSKSKNKGNCKKPGSCSKPGDGKPSAQSLRKMQEQLNKQIEQLKNNMNPFGNKAGQQQSMNEQLARLAAQQEAIRRKMQSLSNDIGNNWKQGKENMNNVMKQMEQTETDLVNKVISKETMNRQKEILTRLLESEKAEQERDTDNKRKSNEAKDENYSNQIKKFQYNKIKLSEEDLLKTSLPSLNVFYKNKVNMYFNNFND